ncbi:carbamoyltransferase [Desulfocicer vacuolatum DSM 3385]|uniref:Carbamoyltransferase n=1 Tax=Desulfocicer vacuolatum DSM 3385 TaxID=1121400 RepID=A0A1W2BU81_9BACT|nr:carbamoyltransferase [Desulfocicer vacuolatum]SMC76459.1 carbamoyltransferase [Desulfocicer vacuolatum DSM 3385]
MNIIGISAWYHDSAAALLVDGELVAAAQEERFSRIKHDPSFPEQSIRFCLSSQGITLGDVDYVVFYDKPLIKFERLLETYLAYAPRGLRSFLTSMPVWLKEKLFLKQQLRKSLSALSHINEKSLPPLMFTEHHQAHAASAFFPSPFDRAAVLCVDGVGEWATTSVWQGDGNVLDPMWEIHFPHSLGLLYSAFTYYTGFRVNSGEYKLMGLAPYGEPRYVKHIYENLIDVKPDGSFQLNMAYFNYAVGLTMTNQRFAQLFGGPPRTPESPITQKEMDLARSIQVVMEEVLLSMASHIRRELDVDYLCMAGGVALNCVANGKLLESNLFKKIWIQPAASDAGGAVGAAFSLWHEYLGHQRTTTPGKDKMRGARLGPAYGTRDVTAYLDNIGATYQILDEETLLSRLALLIDQGNVVGWFQGAMEFGPRALGGRSIIADPRSSKMQSILNLKIKNRESFRPFAPSVKKEDAAEWFDLPGESPYMLLVARIQKEKQISMSPSQKNQFGMEKLKAQRSGIPAVTHVDYSARVQTVNQETSPFYWKILDHFKNLTGCPVLINTSFNVRGEPIVCSPEDAYACFMGTEMDYLVMENVLLSKKKQSQKGGFRTWASQFSPD